MKYDSTNRLFDCKPTLTDSQVLEFCREGFLHLPEVTVPDDINQRTCDYLEGRLPANPSFLPAGKTREDIEKLHEEGNANTILLEDWFIEHVLLNAQITGALRSLLGKNVVLPHLMSDHRVECPLPAQNWHHDADCIFGPELNFFEVFYFPQDTPPELGPSEIRPRSHIRRTLLEPEDTGILSDGPAGMMGIHHQSIVHRRGESTATGVRHMLKFNYWRSADPTRDWIVEPDFDFEMADYGTHEHARYVAHMFYWLCGRAREFRIVGGEAWPRTSDNQILPSFGFGAKQGYLPDWRGTSQDLYVKPSGED